MAGKQLEVPLKEDKKDELAGLLNAVASPKQAAPADDGIVEQIDTLAKADVPAVQPEKKPAPKKKKKRKGNKE